MTRAWREHPAALDELHGAALWFDDRRAGLGDEFMDAVNSTIRSVLDPTITWGFYLARKSTPQLYARSVRGFPYDIVYIIDDAGDVLIVAYAHERRRGEYWIERTANL